MSLMLKLQPGPDRGPPSVAEMTAAFGVPDDGSRSFEIGRAETGATCLVSLDDDEGWSLLVPVQRAPWSARDLLPACEAAAASLGARWADRPLLEAWDEEHARQCRTLVEACAAAGVALPPHRERAVLDDVHRWLLELAKEPAGAPAHVHALDPADGSLTLFAVRLPLEHARMFVPLVDGVLAGEPPLLYRRSSLGDDVVVEREQALAALADEEGEAIGRFRFVTPVEVLDVESLLVP